MLGIYDISESETQFVISRKLGQELLNSRFISNLRQASPGLAEKLIKSVAEAVKLLEPSDIRLVSDASTTYSELINLLKDEGSLIPLSERFPNSFLARSSKSDVARTEKSTYICTSGSEDDAGPTNNWMHSEDAKEKLTPLLHSSMNGKTMYVVPYWLGPLGSPFGQAGVEVTDSPYVVVNLLMITKAGDNIAREMARAGSFVFGIHSMKDLDPDNKYICHFPEENEGSGLIISVNSNYGGNALLSKKCHALRIASARSWKEGWLAEHMMLIGIKSPEGKETFVSAAFPSASGKTNLSMIEPPENLRREGWSTSLISDDIIWLFNQNGALNAINPESGFFGVAPNTNAVTNANAMNTISHDTIFTNVGLDSNNEPFWEGLRPPDKNMIDWTGSKYSGTGNVAHPNSRFTTRIDQYPKLSDYYNKPDGAPVSAFLYGGRRATLVPLVFETYSWAHGVLLGAMQRVETTAAAEFKAGIVRNDPMAIRPFLAYNMADYFSHHLEVGSRLTSPPKVFSVNWFRKDKEGKFLWPGYSQNMYVLRWILDEVAGSSSNRIETPLGYMPEPDYFVEFGFDRDKIKELLSVDTAGYLKELEQVKPFFDSFGNKFPDALWKEYYALKHRLESGN